MDASALVESACRLGALRLPPSGRLCRFSSNLATHAPTASAGSALQNGGSAGEDIVFVFQRITNNAAEEEEPVGLGLWGAELRRDGGRTDVAARSCMAGAGPGAGRLKRKHGLAVASTTSLP